MKGRMAMKLDVKKSLSGGEFKVDVVFRSYEVFEEGLLEDFGTPELKIPVSTWGATAAEDGGKIVISDVEKDKSGADCTIDITKEIVVKLDNTFKTSFSVKIVDLEESEITGATDTVVKLAEAKCSLFIEVIKKEAKAKMDALRAMKTDFEAVITNPETIRV